MEPSGNIFQLGYSLGYSSALNSFQTAVTLYPGDVYACRYCPPVSGPIHSVTFTVLENNSGVVDHELSITITHDSGGFPDLTSTVDGGLLGNSSMMVPVGANTFSGWTASLSAGTQYWIVLQMMSWFKSISLGAGFPSIPSYAKTYAALFSGSWSYLSTTGNVYVRPQATAPYSSLLVTGAQSVEVRTSHNYQIDITPPATIRLIGIVAPSFTIFGSPGPIYWDIYQGGTQLARLSRLQSPSSAYYPVYWAIDTPVILSKNDTYSFRFVAPYGNTSKYGRFPAVEYAAGLDSEIDLQPYLGGTRVYLLPATFILVMDYYEPYGSSGVNSGEIISGFYRGVVR